LDEKGGQHESIDWSKGHHQQVWSSKKYLNYKKANKRFTTFLWRHETEREDNNECCGVPPHHQSLLSPRCRSPACHSGNDFYN